MTAKKSPKKPSEPLGKVVFPKKGKPRRIVETLPEDNKDLEEVIVRKFIGALEFFEGRSIANPERGERWPDFETYEGETRVGIELVNVINVGHAQKRSRQEDYAKRVNELISNASDQMLGLAITLDDGYQNPPYPPLNSKEGEALVQQIADNLRSAVPDLMKLEIGQFFGQRWTHGPASPVTGVFGRRLESSETGSRATVRSYGSFPESVQYAQTLLARAVALKIEARYSAYSEG